MHTIQFRPVGMSLGKWASYRLTPAIYVVPQPPREKTKNERSGSDSKGVDLCVVLNEAVVKTTTIMLCRLFINILRRGRHHKTESRIEKEGTSLRDQWTTNKVLLIITEIYFTLSLSSRTNAQEKSTHAGGMTSRVRLSPDAAARSEKI
jgi:hypothetical protein